MRDERELTQRLEGQDNTRWAARLQREAGVLAGRLADLLAKLAAPGEDGPVATGVLVQLAAAAAADSEAVPSSLAPHPLDRLARALALAPVEVDLLLLAGLPEEHEALAAVMRTLHPRGEPRPTVALAAQLFCQSLEERHLLRESLESGAAARSGIIRLTSDAPFYERTLSVCDGLWSALHGSDVWPTGVRVSAEPPASHGLRSWLDSAEVHAVTQVLTRAEAATVLVLADSEEIAARRAMALCDGAGLPAVRLCCDGVVNAELERAISAHALARGAVPVVQLQVADGPSSSVAPTFARHPGPVVICLREGAASARGPRPIIPLRIESALPAAREAMWRELLPELGDDARALAGRFTLEPAAAAEVACDVRAEARWARRPPTPADVSRSVRVRSNLAVSAAVKLIRPTACWEDLVLPADALAQLREAAARLSHKSRVLEEWGFLGGRRGSRGVRVLLSGPPGTGKTLSAEVLAGALEVDLLSVDISKVVSKWIGETEKNLAAVFDAAERAHAVLFFDECDALFGVRTEVSDAHDRYANLETAFLLSRLERFEGMAVLATNLKQNVDPAFMRRLEFVIALDEPDIAQRVALWQVHLPPRAPRAPDLDLEEIATIYPIVGGLIRNAAVAAGFLAAEEQSPITRVHIVRAIRREYEKAGRAFPGLLSGMSALTH